MTWLAKMFIVSLPVVTSKGSKGANLLEQLIHNGIIIPPKPELVGLCLTIRGEKRELTPKQEEMAMAWAHKKDTEYVQDPVFAENFMADFSQELGLKDILSLEEIDFTPAYALVDKERQQKEAISKEERKALSAERKEEREALKKKYGHAIVNGQLVQLGNYMTEPSGIFMGRGEHPLRGRWKEGATERDVTLNLSPDAPRPEGDWEEVVWQPESMWVARWKDKLSDKLKYIWLSDTAPVKQEREAAKFDKAVHLEEEIDTIRQRIQDDLRNGNEQTRMVATACYLIDALCLRVGDEKDPDEADTVGATTLRPEHLKLGKDNVVEFDFLGKDSVVWHKKLTVPDVVLENLRELIANARPSKEASDDDRNHPTRDLPQLFPDVGSHDVNVYLSSIVPGLSAKVFRTHHATMVVQETLKSSKTKARDPEYKKWYAASQANLAAAELCNHTKKYNGDWERTSKRYQERGEKAAARIEAYRAQVNDYQNKLKGLRAEARQKEEAATTPEQKKKIRERYEKRIKTALRNVEAAKERRKRAQDAAGKVQCQHEMAGHKRTWNLGTSLRSYIDPRVYYAWGKSVDYDIIDKYYPSTLRRKFHWVRLQDQEVDMSDMNGVTVRTCLPDADAQDDAIRHGDVDAVRALFHAVRDQFPDIPLPLEAGAIEAMFLPSLSTEWREAIVVMDGTKLLGFASIGPEWDDGDPETDAMSVLAITRPDLAQIKSVARLISESIYERLLSYQVHFPRKDFVLIPRDPSWAEAFPALAEALGLVDNESDEEDE